MSYTQVPHDPTATIIVNEELTARGQLQTAIALWFSYGDPVSIHTLAAAAQGILQGLVGKNHQHPHMREWIKKYPQRVQKIIRDPQNFFKRGWTRCAQSITLHKAAVRVNRIATTESVSLHEQMKS